MNTAYRITDAFPKTEQISVRVGAMSSTIIAWRRDVTRHYKTNAAVIAAKTSKGFLLALTLKTISLI
jgi:hypothetical protein